MCDDKQCHKEHNVTKTETKSIMPLDTSTPSISNSSANPRESPSCLRICTLRMNSLREYKIVCIVFHSCQLYLLYFFWIILHSFSANAYVYFCAHPSVYGVIHSFLFSQSPHCKMLFFLTDVGSQMINAVWISVGLWLVNTIARKYPKITVRNDYLPSKSSIHSVVR
jgi:hypothetical protein